MNNILAAKLNITHAAISNIRQDKPYRKDGSPRRPTIDQFNKISAAFDLTSNEQKWLRKIAFPEKQNKL